MGIAIGKNQKVYIAIETNTSTNVPRERIKKPTARTEINMNLLFTAGEGTVNQEREKLPDERLRGGRSKYTDIPARYNPGTWNFPMYLNTGGLISTNAGNMVVGELDVPLTLLFGERTTDVDSSSSDSISDVTAIVYSLTDTNPSATIWFEKDHSVFCCVGATANEGAFDINGSALGMVTFSGEFMQMFRGGTSTLDTTLPSSVSETDIVLATGHGKRYDAGMFIKIGTDTNSGAGYQIDSITNDTLTLVSSDAITPTADIVAGATVKGYIPLSDDASYTGYNAPDPVHGKRGFLSLGGVDTNILSGTLTFNNNIAYNVDEKNGIFYASDYFNSEFRDVSGELNLYFREGDIAYWNDALEDTQFAFVLPCGDVDGQIVQLNAPNARLNAPSVAGENEVTMTIGYSIGRDAANNDELTCTLT